jgi:CheY-like chemotaxis protein
VAGQLSGTAVLVADGDAESSTSSRTSSRKKARQSEALRTRERLWRSRTWRPDVILLDIAMPEMDGYDLLATIRREPSLRAIPAVAVTGHGYARDKQRAEDVGFAKHITKPVDIDTLVDVIAELVPCPPVAS